MIKFKQGFKDFSRDCNRRDRCLILLVHYIAFTNKAQHIRKSAYVNENWVVQSILAMELYTSCLPSLSFDLHSSSQTFCFMFLSFCDLYFILFIFPSCLFNDSHFWINLQTAYLFFHCFFYETWFWNILAFHRELFRELEQAFVINKFFKLYILGG